MVVDDNPQIISVIERFLRAAKYDIISANNGVDAIQLINTDKSIDLAIIDVKMPNVTGIDVMKSATRKMIPTLIISGGIGSVDAIAELRELGYNFKDIFHKPLNLYRMLDVIKQKLKYKSV